MNVLPDLCKYLCHELCAVRHMAARCLGVLSRVLTTHTMNMILQNVLPLLDASYSTNKRQGAIESLASILSCNY